MTTNETRDDIDVAIIRELVQSPRRSYSDLARSVGLSAGAAKARVRRLRESRCIRIAGRVDPAVLGYGLFAFAFIEVPGGALEAGHSLGRRHDTAFVVAVGGSASLIVEFRCRDWQHLVVTLDDVRRDPSFVHLRAERTSLAGACHSCHLRRLGAASASCVPARRSCWNHRTSVWLSATSWVRALLASKSLKGMCLRPESLSLAMVSSTLAWARMWASSAAGSPSASVAARKAEGFPTTLCCTVAGVSRQGFYDWRAHRCELTDRERAEAALVAEIREIWASSDGTYGSPRVTAELHARGRRVNAKRVARLMKAHHIAGIRPRRPKRTTIPARHKPKLPDLLNRQFAPGAPDRAWASDITYIRTGEGWLYLAVVLDVGSRRLVGTR